MDEDTTSEPKPVITGSRRRRGRGERAQSVIEFAIAVPVLLTLLLGMVELGNGLNSYIKIISVARDAARLGAQVCTGVTPYSNCDGKLTSLVTTETDSLTTNVPVTCTAGGAGTCITHISLGTNGAGNTIHAVKVAVCYDHPLLFGVPGIISGPLRMCSSTTMRVRG